MSRTNVARSKSQNPSRSTRGRTVGMGPTNKWRCLACSFLCEGDTCNTCGQPKPKNPQNRPPRVINPKPSQIVQPRRRQEEKKGVDVYYDTRDDSENVPIAGIKKHHYDPKMPKQSNHGRQIKPGNQSKKPPNMDPKPIGGGPQGNIHTFSSIRGDAPDDAPKVVRKELPKSKKVDPLNCDRLNVGENNYRDLMGMLQQASADQDVLPCMRKKKGSKK